MVSRASVVMQRYQWPLSKGLLPLGSDMVVLRTEFHSRPSSVTLWSQLEGHWRGNVQRLADVFSSPTGYSWRSP